MAVIDTFLKLMLEKRAERLVLVSDAVPILLRGGETIELSMPALRADMLARIAGEMAGEDVTGRKEGRFSAADGASFGYAILPSAGEFRIEVHAGAVPPPVEEDDPLAKAVAEFARPADAPTPATPAPVVRSGPDLLAVIDQAASLDASDLFLSSGKQPRVRRNGQLAFLDAAAPDAAKMIELIPDETARQTFEESGSVDFATRWELSGGSRRFRINVFRHRDGVAAALRPIRQKIPPLADLGLSDDLLDLVHYPSGLVLVTGTTGSGKSTTLAALVDHLNCTRQRHVITIEDPVEYEHRENQCLIHQREVGADVESFSTGLRAALRENPDVILLGELRDLDTISAALTAAETGHLVLGTLHSGTASSAVNRIVDVFPGHQQQHIRVQLALSLRAVVSQRLVPTKSKKLVPAIEKLVVTSAVATGIREGQDHYLRNAMLTGVEEGMITLERSLASLLRKGVIDRETAVRHAMDPKALQHLLE
ncbi:PilT/PilU family type 4a pilus ATPase [Luteolibacter flavescens]|uniref:PilT/PilU family type 4a pilus ATPase n=1 Tax=Luteolibacter flavescens TaxID=1859460 RepID=A0ABT3FTL0_9BACT|nr:PilT/PilU family type 4a pilus ATPase [Luteolibacter flavescens]MCW1886921.1 PilT/PilU family type 4a pilus ATPase [Luteolibacter flavescens]